MGLSFGLAQKIGKTGDHGPTLQIGDHAQVQRALRARAKKQAKAEGVVPQWRFSYWSDRDGQCLDKVVTAGSKTAAVKLIRAAFPHIKKSAVEYHTNGNRGQHFHRH